MIVNERLYKDGCAVDDRHKVCRSRGGESCAFDGAMIVLQPIGDCAHLVHGPIACLGNSWDSRGTINKHSGLYRKGLTTAMSSLDIVYGGEEKLFNAIVKTVDDLKPSAVFVYSTCVSGLIGEDMERVCKQAQEKTGIRIIPVNSPGFVGPKNLGNRMAGDCLLEHVVGTSEPETMTDMPTINIIGEYNIAGDIFEMEEIFNSLGIRILSRITGNARFKEITYAHRADLNVLVCSRALINLAYGMQKRYGIPFIEVSFFGMTEVSKAILNIATLLQGIKGCSDLLERAREFVDRRERQVRETLDKKYNHLRGKKAILYGGGVKSWSFINALLDLGIEPVAVATKKATVEDEEKVKAILNDDSKIFIDTSPKNLMRLYKEKSADMLIAGSRNLYIAVKEGYPYVDINQERHIPYAGYEGLINFAQQISEGLRFYGSKSPIVPRHGVTAQSDVMIDPLRHSQSIGAVMALHGIDRAVPILHGAQGCTFLSKVLLTKHFKEPITVISSRLFTEDVVMGSEERLKQTIKDVVERSNPQLVAVISTSLTEVKGDDIAMVVKTIKKEMDSRCRLVYIPTPDYEGGLQDGYTNVITTILKECIKKDSSPFRDVRQINVLVGHHLTPADFWELRTMFEIFHLKPLIMPDLSCLDGSTKGFSSLPTGGISIEDIEKMSGSQVTIAIGASMRHPAKILKDNFGIDYIEFEGISGIANTDRFLDTLSFISDSSIPHLFKRQRAILVDGMRDAHFYVRAKRAIVALEQDHAINISDILAEAGLKNVLTVVPDIDEGTIGRIQSEVVLQGTFNDIKDNADIIISSSHAEETAQKLKVPLYEIGFPTYSVVGNTHKITIGYRGALNIINDISNILHKKGG
ncbi:MAG: nitrogenase iron-molybdenum cofactor biosynthesis protein NifE [Thermodesulfovibrionales bacterium]